MKTSCRGQRHPNLRRVHRVAAAGPLTARHAGAVPKAANCRLQAACKSARGAASSQRALAHARTGAASASTAGSHR
eukprot:11188692-Lingulodinium_polyedra.AAC.1